ncbi:LysR family transcriptional regulator [Streptococcus thoraltensis]|uniref:LysR family transcriptional regulator n=1 Tax=Streptococcus thoraltensis TaxID=55085 RepID=UPI00036F55B9|nr:LysR family transcriptional regulator [Streptococcus thoraltensis]MDY4761395.1 LysR family transcriptional regulator [Streptococcus thoraltensis]
MNIQQLRYVVAIANSGTFREAASKLYVSQPSLSVAIKDLETELDFQIFTRTTTGAVLTAQGMTFYEKALEVVKSFDSFEKHFIQPEEEDNQFSIASQHYDFLPPLMTEFSQTYPELKDFRIFESTTIQILDEVSKGFSQIGIIYMNHQNESGLFRRMEKLGLESVDLISFRTHIYLSKNHPLAEKEKIQMDDLAGLPTVKFAQEKDEYLYYSENLVDTSDSTIMYHVTDRATLNGILERTDAYATGSGFLDERSVNGITVVPLEDHLVNKMVYVKRKDVNLSPQALAFIKVMTAYFDKYKP